MGYKTITDIYENETTEKKSRFIAKLYPIQSEDEVKEILNLLKKEHHQARHFCTAFRLHGAQMVERYSDDGEPGGTAGMPMLEVLRGVALENCLIVSIRYFGGTKLGTGGLVRAYTQSAQGVVAIAETVEIGRFVRLSVVVDYGITGKLEYHVNQQGYLMDDVSYGEKVTFILYIDEMSSEGIKAEFRELTNGTCDMIAEKPVDGYIRHGNFVQLST